MFEQVTDERSTAMQEYIDNLRAFAAQQDNAPALAKVEQELETVTRRKDKLLDLALAGALSNEEFRQRNEACNEQLAASSSSERNCKMQTKRSSSAFGAWKACAAPSRSGGRQTAVFRARCPRRSSTASS